MALGWLMIAGAIALLSFILILIIGCAGAVFNLSVWLLGRVGVLLIRLVGWIILGIRLGVRWVIDRIRDARL